jgi:hypothetical protein
MQITLVLEKYNSLVVMRLQNISCCTFQKRHRGRKINLVVPMLLCNLAHQCIKGNDAPMH